MNMQIIAFPLDNLKFKKQTFASGLFLRWAGNERWGNSAQTYIQDLTYKYPCMSVWELVLRIRNFFSTIPDPNPDPPHLSVIVDKHNNLIHPVIGLPSLIKSIGCVWLFSVEMRLRNISLITK